MADAGTGGAAAAIAAGIADVVKTYRLAFALRYLSVAGLAVYLYEWIIVSSDELRLIYRRPLSFLKIVYLLCKICALGVNVVANVDALGIGHQTGTWCHIAWLLSVVLVVLTEYMANGLLIFRIFILWDRNRRVMILLGVGFILCEIAFTICMVFVARDLKDAVLVIGGSLRSCGVNATIAMAKIAWLPNIAFDIYAIFLLYLNVLDRPRTPDARLARLLVSDGLFSLLTHLLFRICGLIFTLTTPPGLYVFAFSPVYTFTVIINSRMFLNILEYTSPRGQKRSLHVFPDTMQGFGAPSSMARELPEFDENLNSLELRPKSFGTTTIMTTSHTHTHST